MESKIKDVSRITERHKRLFWAKVNKTDSCWNWTAAAINGYGSFGGGKERWFAHRLSYFLVKGFQATKCLLHSCDNRRCVNPDHLWEGTKTENNKDRALKGRSAIGEKHGGAKLTESDVREIRLLKESQKISNRKLSLMFGVSETNIGRILSRGIWKHIFD